MSGNLNRRVSRLESEGGEGCVFLVLKDEGEGVKNAMKKAGIESVDNNTIVFMTRVWRDPGEDLPNQDGEVQ